MTTAEKTLTDLPEPADAPTRAAPHPGHEMPAPAQSPYRKPSDVGCVLAAGRPAIGELSPEAYAAFLEEL